MIWFAFSSRALPWVRLTHPAVPLPPAPGILISSLSSALGSLFGGSRVLQAMARDKLMPVLKPFAYGSKHGDEPRVAVLFTWLVAQVSMRAPPDCRWGTIRRYTRPGTTLVS